MTKNKLWNFYINKTKNQIKGKEVVATYCCQKPERTKIWKNLQKRLNDEDIEAIGFEEI